MALINSEINLQLTCSAKQALVTGTVANQEPKRIITDTKLYVPVVTISTQDDTKLLEKLLKGFKKVIKWNKSQSKIPTEARNRYLDFLIDSSSRGVHRRFILSFENKNDPESYEQYFLPTLGIKDHNVMIDGKTFLIKH